MRGHTPRAPRRFQGANRRGRTAPSPACSPAHTVGHQAYRKTVLGSRLCADRGAAIWADILTNVIRLDLLRCHRLAG